MAQTAMIAIDEICEVVRDRYAENVRGVSEV